MIVILSPSFLVVILSPSLFLQVADLKMRVQTFEENSVDKTVVLRLENKVRDLETRLELETTNKHRLEVRHMCFMSLTLQQLYELLWISEDIFLNSNLTLCISWIITYILHGLKMNSALAFSQ